MLTVKQKRFCIEYVKSGNATLAYMTAYGQKKSDSARAAASALLRNVKVQSRIKELEDKIMDEKILDAKEIQTRLSAIARREVFETVTLPTGEQVQKQTSIKDSVRALELLAKINGLFVSKSELEISGAVPVVVVEVINNLPVVLPNYDKLIEEWIAFTKKHSGLKSAQSERSYRNAINQALIYFRGHGIDILSATDDDVYSWLEYLKAEKSASTVQMYLVAVRLFFAFLAKEKIIAENPCLGMKAGVKIKRDEHKRDYLSAEKVREMITKMPVDSEMALRNRAVVVLMVTSGLRCCEVQEAQCGDMRTSGDSTFLYLRGKGYTDKDNCVKVEPTAEKFIREYWAFRFKGKTPKDKDYMFISTSRNHAKLDKDDMLSTQSIRAIVKDALKKIGINDSRHTAHSLRHTACTLALKSGEELTNVQQMMRHARLDTTLIYSHALEREQNNAELAIGRMIFGDK